MSYPKPGSNPNSVYPARFGNQEVISPSHPSIAKRGSNSEPLDAPIDETLAINIHYTSYFIGVIGLEAVYGEVAGVNARESMNFASNSVLGKNPRFVDLGLLPANTADKLNSVFYPSTRTGGLTDISNWLASGHGIVEVTEGRVSKVQSYIDYIKNYDFETMNVSERENNSRSRINPDS